MCHEWHAHHHFVQMVFWDRKYDAANTNEIKPCRMCFTCFNPLRFSPSFCLTLPLGDWRFAVRPHWDTFKVKSVIPRGYLTINSWTPNLQSSPVNWVRYGKKNRKKNIVPCSSMCSSMIYKNRKNLLKNCGIWFFPWPSCWFHAPRSRDLRRRR